MNNPSEPPHNLPGAELPHEQKNFSNEPQRLEQTKSEGENSEKIDTPDKKGSDQSENKTLSPSNPQRDLFILLGIFAFVILLYILSTFFSGGNGQQNSEQNPQKQQQTIAAQQATGTLLFQRTQQSFPFIMDGFPSTKERPTLPSTQSVNILRLVSKNKT
jgi:hypothetical protein